MPYRDRLPLIRKIAELRSSVVICYLTSTRPNASAQMAEDAVRIFFDHLLKLEQRPIENLDIFLCSNGGNGVVPWRLVSLFREFAKKVSVLIPYRAYSAATMLALGADEIVMHPFAEMGPIDPTVANNFNPVDSVTKQRLGIGVEDVKAYVAFIKDTVGIRHEDELIKAIEILAQQVHPLALGNVERFIAQSRMITRKILLTHMSDEKSGHEIDDTIEILASKLYFHGHPINRREARDELKLKVAPEVSKELEEAMWQLYLEFEKDMLNNQPFDPMLAIVGQRPATAQAPAQPLPPLQPNALSPQVPIVPVGFSATFDSKAAIIECANMSSQLDVQRRYIVAGTGPKAEPLLHAETVKQSWTTIPAPAPIPPRSRRRGGAVPHRRATAKSKARRGKR